MFIFKKAIKTIIFEHCIDVFFSNFKKIFYTGVDESILKLLDFNNINKIVIDAYDGINVNGSMLGFISILYPKTNLINQSVLEITGIAPSSIDISVLNKTGGIDTYIMNKSPESIKLPINQIKNINTEKITYMMGVGGIEFSYYITLKENNSLNIDLNNYRNIHGI